MGLLVNGSWSAVLRRLVLVVGTCLLFGTVTADTLVQTLEDFYGDTGDSFQAALGFVSVEGTTNSVAQESYGLAVDDMVVKWKEFTLEEDATDCEASGSCAVIQLATTNVFESRTSLTVTVLDPVPDAANDCDLDGTPDATNDCNGNLTPDVVVKATSLADVTGEILFLDQVGDSIRYSAAFAVSTLSDGSGVLYVAQDGSSNPTVTVTYLDNDIDPGPAVEVCPSDVDPAKHGVLRDFATIFVDGSCEVTVVRTEVFDNGDGDEFADTEETVDMEVCFLSNCGFDLHNCTARLFGASPEVDCIIDSTIDVGDLDTSEDVVCIADRFRWKVADVNRSDVDELFQATFQLTMVCDEIDALSVMQQFSLSLDLTLDVLGQTPTAWNEGFESSTLGKFFAENLDAGLPGANNNEGHINGDGYRCQYNDPDWTNAYNYGNPEDCYPGNNLADSNAVRWAVDGIDTGSPDGGRAKTGEYAAYYGIYLTDPAGQFTTPSAVIESIATTDPINLGIHVPELSYWQQVSLMDNRGLNMNNGRSADNGVVQGKLVNVAGEDTTDWFNLQPYQNPYDTQGYFNYFSCFFDPIDDGSTEDDFFDPVDPNRFLGPSSTCFPEFSYSCMGETSLPFSPGNACNATTAAAPDEAGDLGVGTWVQGKVDLSEFRGKRIRLRYLVANMKFSPHESWESAFAPDFNPDPRDDGWWVDDISIDESLASPAVLIVDENDLAHCLGDPGVGCLTVQDCIDAGTAGPCSGAAPQCGPTCTALAVAVVTDPDENGGALDEVLTAPGQAISLNVSGSSGQCLDGALLFRFSESDGGILREFSENAVLVVAPQAPTDYLVELRCSADGPGYGCDDSAIVDVDSGCPSSGDLASVFPQIQATDKTTWEWLPAKEFLLYSNPIGIWYGSAAPTAGSGTTFSDSSVPLPGTGTYHLARELGEFCNERGPWTACNANDEACLNAESPSREPGLP